MTTPARRFPLALIVTAHTGISLGVNLAMLRDFIDYITGETHMLHQLGRAADDAVIPHLAALFPWLADITVPPITGASDGLAFLREIEAIYGAEHEVTPLPFGAYVGREPVAEFQEEYPDTSFAVAVVYDGLAGRGTR